jgi:DNA-3-methyladenine glycosylase II
MSQQLSARVAAVIYDRYVALFPGGRPSPQEALRLSPTILRKAGLSNQKGRYVQDLAAGFLDGRIRPRAFPHTANEDLIVMLTSIHGVGRWTAEMFLMFALNRQDVLPVDDLGIRKAIQRWYGFLRLPAPRTIRRIGKAWSPYETIACWYLWRSLGDE